MIASVWRLFKTHKSSTTPAVCGSSSLIHVPFWPWRANSKIEPASGSVAWLALIVVSR